MMRADDGDGEEGRRAIVRLIDTATNSTAGEVSPRLLKAIKSAVRSSDADLRAAARSLLDLMKRPHSHVRYLTILIVDELFMRSKLFRSLVVVDLDKLLSLGVGFRRDAPLPPPSSSASRLREKAIELLEKWNDAFGMHYRQLRLGYHYLKHTLKFQFPNLQEAAARQQQERREREVRTQELLRTKFENLKEKLPSLRAEVRSAVDEIQECIDIFSVGDDAAEEFAATVPIDDEEDVEEFRTQELRQIRMSTMKESMKIRENSDNRPIFDALRELLKLLVSRHLPSVQEWISVLIRVDLADNSFRDAALKELIDTRNLIQSVKNRCSELGCVLNESTQKEEEEDDDMWEEGKIELYKPDNDNSIVLERPVEKSVAPPSSSKQRTSVKDELKSSDNPREKLLAEAPVMTWGPFLDNWGSNHDVLANQRGLELEGHWGRVDYDAVIPAEKIAELSVHRTVYQEEPTEIRPCLAPLKKGGLCQRRDLKVCPFHGPIVPRDAEGNPIVSTYNGTETETSINANEQKHELPADDESLGFGGMGSKELPKKAVKISKERGKGILKLVKSAKVPCDEGKTEPETSIEVTNQEGDLLVADDFGDVTDKELAKQAVKNVRESDMKALKQAKRAKIREHNELMLREAAIASTSYSEALQEERDASFDNHSHVTTKKPTLASMLKKKVTTKTRIAQKLLNARVTDSASKQLVQAQESKYREAFPNQW